MHHVILPYLQVKFWFWGVFAVVFSWRLALRYFSPVSEIFSYSPHVHCWSTSKASDKWRVFPDSGINDKIRKKWINGANGPFTICSYWRQLWVKNAPSGDSFWQSLSITSSLFSFHHHFIITHQRAGSCPRRWSKLEQHRMTQLSKLSWNLLNVTKLVRLLGNWFQPSHLCLDLEMFERLYIWYREEHTLTHQLLLNISIH